MAEIKSVSVRHEAILQYLMVNPRVPLGIVAQHFGISQGWLSQVIHSDAFAERLRECRDVAFHETVLPLREKMLNVAHQALDQLQEVLPLEKEAQNLSKIAGDVLDRLGFSAKTPVVQFNQQNNYTVLRAEVEAARAHFGGQATPPPLEVAKNGDGRTMLALPRESVPDLGAAFAETALSLVATENGESQVGRALREEGPCEA